MVVDLIDKQNKQARLITDIRNKQNEQNGTIIQFLENINTQIAEMNVTIAELTNRGNQR